MPMNRRALLRLAVIVPLAGVAAPLAKLAPVQGECGGARIVMAWQLHDAGLYSRSSVASLYGYDKIIDRLDDAIDVQHFTWPHTIEVAGALPPGTTERIFGPTDTVTIGPKGAAT